MFAKLAGVGANGLLTAEEVLRRFEQGVQLEERLRTRLLAVFRSAQTSDKSFFDFVGDFRNTFAKEPQVLVSLVNAMFRVTVHDGALAASHEALIRKASTLFSFPAGAYEGLRAGFVESESPHVNGQDSQGANGRTTGAKTESLALLGCTPSSSNDDIQKAYRRLALLYHPDVHSSVDLPESFVEDLKGKFRQIQLAYEEVRKSRGF